ncbi:MAG: GNAT family N-acetyltransferase [Gemmatimonadales bacterium]|jgi:predicted N-acetyltransferase YhbS|nr:MAG: GNAT family N-acetyltransferase [Gemmatimonadales bacterium]
MPTDRVDIVLTPAGEDHIPAMASLWAEAFPEKPAERRAREIREGFTYGDLTDCWVVEVEGRLAGALRTYRLEMNLWGRRLPTMGLAGVAVAPDFRRRGIGRRMCVEALRIARDRGDVLCALYPFRASFYRELGFALAGDVHRYRFHPTSMPMYPGWDRVERAPEDGRELAVRLYGSVAPRTNGLLTRVDRMFSFLRRKSTYLYLHRDGRGRATGYVAVRGRGGPPERSRLRVIELIAEDREAYLGLLGWLSVQRDQWGTIVYDAVPGEDFQQRLGHPRIEGSGSPRGLWFHSANILRGPMIRLLDMGTALQTLEELPRVGARPGLSLQDGTIQVRDLELPENQGCWRDGESGESTLDPARGPVLSPSEVVTHFLRGTLPGQPLPPEGWSPNLGFADLRILDEF